MFETKVVKKPVLESEWSYVLHCRWYLFLWHRKTLRLEDLNLAKKNEGLGYLQPGMQGGHVSSVPRIRLVTIGTCNDPIKTKKSERPVDALAVKKMNYSPTDNLKSRDASASKKWRFGRALPMPDRQTDSRIYSATQFV